MTIYEFIEKHEGRRNKAYKCSAGAWSIGVGRNCDANPLPPDVDYYLKQNGQITDEMIDRLLEADVRAAVADCHVLFPEFDSMSEARRMALTDFVFQHGFVRAKKYIHSIACINTGRWEKAGEQMRQSQWFKQAPKRAQEIIEMIEVG